MHFDAYLALEAELLIIENVLTIRLMIQVCAQNIRS